VQATIFTFTITNSPPSKINYHSLAFETS